MWQKVVQIVIRLGNAVKGFLISLRSTVFEQPQFKISKGSYVRYNKRVGKYACSPAAALASSPSTSSVQAGRASVQSGAWAISTVGPT